MSKINPSSNYSNIRPGDSKDPSIKDSSTSGQANYDDKGFYLREEQLLRDENGLLIGTENRDNLLLNILTKDTVDVKSTVENKRNIDNG